MGEHEPFPGLAHKFSYVFGLPVGWKGNERSDLSNHTLKKADPPGDLEHLFCTIVWEVNFSGGEATPFWGLFVVKFNACYKFSLL